VTRVVFSSIARGRRIPVEVEHSPGLQREEAHVVGATFARRCRGVEVDLEGTADARLDSGFGREKGADAFARGPGGPHIVASGVRAVPAGTVNQG
jgi:hypothetical protein